ncbi:3996_t:CDS:2, partial [Entrophospora sp. SA101]
MPGRILFRYTVEEVARHNDISDLWVIHNKKVYDLTDFVTDHPGGPELLKDWAGKDVSNILSDPSSHLHSEIAYEVLLESCIGEVVQTADEFEVKNTNIVNDYQKEKFLDLTKPLFLQMFNCNFTKEFYLKQIHQPRHLPYSAKLFGNDYLELLTKTPWYIVPILWIPISVYHGYMASEALNPLLVFMLFLCGIVVWTLLEYTLHRFLFHVDNFLPDHPYALTIHFTLHGIHHYLPMDKLRLVMPPVLGGAIAYPIITLGKMIFPENIAHGIIAGAVFGYVCYDLTHYHLHHAKPFGDHFKTMKTYHLAQTTGFSPLAQTQRRRNSSGAGRFISQIVHMLRTPTQPTDDNTGGPIIGGPDEDRIITIRMYDLLAEVVEKLVSSNKLEITFQTTEKSLKHIEYMWDLFGYTISCIEISQRGVGNSVNENQQVTTLMNGINSQTSTLLRILSETLDSYLNIMLAGQEYEVRLKQIATHRLQQIFYEHPLLQPNKAEQDIISNPLPDSTRRINGLFDKSFLFTKVKPLLLEDPFLILVELCMYTVTALDYD